LAIRGDDYHLSQRQDCLDGSPQTFRFETIIVRHQDEWLLRCTLLPACRVGRQMLCRGQPLGIWSFFFAS
jgi:hypothetical protein